MNEYKFFIKKEKEFSDKFLKQNQIYNNRFDENEYIIVKELFNDNKINKIYDVIDKIVDDFNLNSEIRYLIMGDLLFTISIYKANEPTNLIFKISRNEYIYLIEERSKINKIFGIDNYVKIHQKLLAALDHYNLIKKELIVNKKDRWSSIMYFKIEFNEINLENKYIIWYSKYPFVIDLSGEYVIGSFRNVWKIKRKRKEMDDFKTCNKSIIKANSIRYELDYNLYLLNKNIIKKEEKKLLTKLNCENLEDFYRKLKNLLSDIKFLKKWSCNELDKEIKEEYRIISDNLQKINCFNLLNRDIFNNKIYLPCFKDNRNRQYYGTDISPTFYKIMRNLFKFSEKKELNELENSIYFKKIIKYKKLVEEYDLDDNKSYIAIILLIEIGKYYIEEKEDCFYNIEEIVNAGKAKKNKKIKLEDEMYIKKIEKELSNLIKKKNIDTNTIIYKDATASGLQNFGIILGYKKEKLKYLNMDGDNWCDTYKYLINKYMENDKYLNKRKYWKNTIMTIPYNSVWYSCFLKFIEKLREDGIEYNKMNEIEKTKLKIIHKNFYNKMKENMKKEFFKKEKGDFKEFKYIKWMISNKKEYKINYKKIRHKYLDISYSNEYDEKATLRSNEANNMHYLDSLLVEELLNYFEVITVHDCFGIRLCEVHKVIDKINEYYSNRTGYNHYGLFIIK